MSSTSTSTSAAASSSSTSKVVKLCSACKSSKKGKDGAKPCKRVREGKHCKIKQSQKSAKRSARGVNFVPFVARVLVNPAKYEKLREIEAANPNLVCSSGCTAVMAQVVNLLFQASMKRARELQSHSGKSTMSADHIERSFKTLFPTTKQRFANLVSNAKQAIDTYNSTSSSSASTSA